MDTWTPNTLKKAMARFSRASSVSTFPYEYNALNPYLELFPDGRIQPVERFVDSRRPAFRRAAALESALIVGWTGQWRTDTFWVDKPDRLVLS